MAKLKVLIVIHDFIFLKLIDLLSQIVQIIGVISIHLTIKVAIYLILK